MRAVTAIAPRRRCAVPDAGGDAMMFFEPAAKIAILFTPAFAARTVSGRKRSGFVEKEELGPALGRHQACGKSRDTLIRTQCSTFAGVLLGMTKKEERC